ncbi:MAG: oligosaccharide flippase family protein [Methanosarcinales archaeon]
MTLKKDKYSIGEKLISNTFYLFLDWVTIAFFSFIFWSVTAKFLNDRDLVGIVSTSINFTILVYGFSTLGMISALKKLVPEIRKTKGKKGLYSLAKISIKPVLVSLLIISLILFSFSSQLSVLVNIPTYAFILTTLSIISIFIFDFFGSIIYGLQNMKLLLLTDAAQIILRIILTIFLILIGLSYLGPLTAFLLAYFLISIFRFNPNYIKSRQKLISYKKLFSYAIPALIALFSTSIILNGQYIILSSLQSIEDTGIFTIAFTLSSMIAMLSHVLASALFPIISSLSVERKTKRRQGYLIGIILRYSLFLIIPLSALLMIFSKHIILIYSAPRFLLATSYLPILIPASILYGLGTIFLVHIYAIGKPKLQRDIMILSALCFLIISPLLTNYFSVLGISLSFFLIMSLRFSLGLKYIRKYLKIELFLKDNFKIFLSSFTIAFISLLFRSFISNIFILILFLIPISLAYFFLLFIFKFYRIEDIKILIYFGKRIPFGGKYILSIANFVKNKL